jgi:hypothetical protein
MEFEGNPLDSKLLKEKDTSTYEERKPKFCSEGYCVNAFLAYRVGLVVVDEWLPGYPDRKRPHE